mmetsp:Transcript_32262/g.67267  ORF Transcript_32262/g.67267 Transcript_32262/m.67267 type:complete len:145 (-) Transcript_32262:155-589(-)
MDFDPDGIRLDPYRVRVANLGYVPGSIGLVGRREMVDQELCMAFCAASSFGRTCFWSITGGRHASVISIQRVSSGPRDLGYLLQIQRYHGRGVSRGYGKTPSGCLVLSLPISCLGTICVGYVAMGMKSVVAQKQSSPKRPMTLL